MGELTDVLTVVDVGARGKPPRELRRLKPARLVAVEPEPAEAARLRDTLSEYEFAAANVAPVALGDGNPATLYLTEHPGFTSICRPTEMLMRFVPSSRVVAEETIETVTLDEAAARYGFTDAAVVKLDTQGSELEILKHGPTVVASAVAMMTEVSFHPLYEGGVLFGELDAFLRDAGFALCDMRRGRMRPAERPDGTPSMPHVLWAHCLYLRKPDGLPDAKLDALYRAAVAFGYFDLADAIRPDGGPYSADHLGEQYRDPSQVAWKD